MHGPCVGQRFPDLPSPVERACGRIAYLRHYRAREILSFYLRVQVGFPHISKLFPLTKRVLEVIGGTDLMYVFCSVALYTGPFNSNTRLFS